MDINPLGYYVLVEMEIVEETTAGGIIISKSMVDREQEATDIGHIRAIGPTAYVGYPGCDGTDSPAAAWGVNVGDRVEYRKYEGKACGVEGYENYRYIPDSSIIGVINDE